MRFTIENECVFISVNNRIITEYYFVWKDDIYKDYVIEYSHHGILRNEDFPIYSSRISSYIFSFLFKTSYDAFSELKELRGPDIEEILKERLTNKTIIDDVFITLYLLIDCVIPSNLDIYVSEIEDGDGLDVTLSDIIYSDWIRRHGKKLYKL